MLGAAIGAVGSIVSAVAQKQVADYNAKVSQMNAAAAVREGFAQAGATRDQYDQVRGTQVAQLAKSGVDVASGTATVLALETQRRAETAAAVDIWKGRSEQTKYLNQADLQKAEGRSALIGGFINAGASLVGAFSGMGRAGTGQGTPLSLGTPTPIMQPVKTKIPVSPGMARFGGVF